MLPVARRRAEGAPIRRSLRRAFTVVEVLVALVVVVVGLLGLAGASATALRASSAAMHERVAITRARTRLALLQAAGCGNAASGEQRLGAGLLDRWTIGVVMNGARLVDVSAEWDDTGRRRVVLLRSALLC